MRTGCSCLTVDCYCLPLLASAAICPHSHPVHAALTVTSQHYTDLKDIKRAIVNTHAIDPAALTEFFGTLSAEWALECLKELLVANMQVRGRGRCQK